MSIETTCCDGRQPGEQQSQLGKQDGVRCPDRELGWIGIRVADQVLPQRDKELSEST